MKIATIKFTEGNEGSLSSVLKIMLGKTFKYEDQDGTHLVRLNAIMPGAGCVELQDLNKKTFKPIRHPYTVCLYMDGVLTTSNIRMSNAFEVTTNDVINVVHRMKRKVLSDRKCTEIYNALNHDLVEIEALKASNELGAQTDAAYDEIERQIKEGNLL